MTLDLAETDVGREPPSEPAAAIQERYHSLDALRAVALLLGILLHAALSYIPGFGGYWAIEDRSTHWLLGAMVAVIHSFRLEVFFLVAGFFARLLLLRRGLSGFALNRLVRIVVPFVCGWLLVAPLLAFAWIWGSRKGELAAVPTALLQGLLVPVGQLANLANLSFLKNGFTLTHLWFLYYLLLVYVVFFSGRFVLMRIFKNDQAWQVRVGDRFLRFLINTRWAVLLLALPTACILLMMNGWGVDTPDRSLLPHIPAFLLYGMAFTIGWLLHRQPDLLEVLARHWRFSLFLAFILMFPALALSSYEWRPASPHLRELRIANQFVYSLMMWSWILALLGIFVRLRKQESRFWRYLSDSSYWLYIVHLPLVVILQVALARFPLPCGIKFVLVCAISIPLLLASYHYLVRSTAIGSVLNGRCYPFRRFPWTIVR